MKDLSMCTYGTRFDTIETAKRRDAVNIPTFLTTDPELAGRAADGFYPIIPIPSQQLRQLRTVVQPARIRVGVSSYPPLGREVAPCQQISGA